MIRHIVTWNLADGLSEAEKADKARFIKEGLEKLAGLVDGAVSIRVETPLPSSSADLILNSLFADAAALAAYQNHPEHVKMAALIRAATKNRVCADFEEI